PGRQFKGGSSMRIAYSLPLAAAIMLAGCGGGADSDGDGDLSADEVAAEAQGLIQPRPGQYRASIELLEFDVPGMPEGAKQQMQQMQQIFASGLAEGNSFCMTEEDAARNGPEEMVKNLAEGDCTMSASNDSCGKVIERMLCAGGGVASTVRVVRAMAAESLAMTMDVIKGITKVGETRMKMRVNSQRIGDCTA